MPQSEVIGLKFKCIIFAVLKENIWPPKLPLSTTENQLFHYREFIYENIDSACVHYVCKYFIYQSQHLLSFKV